MEMRDGMHYGRTFRHPGMLVNSHESTVSQVPENNPDQFLQIHAGVHFLVSKKKLLVSPTVVKSKLILPPCKLTYIFLD